MAHPPIEPLSIFSEETLDHLAGGFLAVVQPELLRVQRSLQELTSNQEAMLKSIHEKRMQFEDTTTSNDILTTLQKIPAYRHKLASISKQTQTLSKRIKRLQQRANKLKEVRVMKDLQRKKEYEKKLERERMLEAKPAK